MMDDPKHLLWINRTKRRYYRLRCCVDLLGDTYVVRTWGSLDSGRASMLVCYVNEPNRQRLVRDLRSRRKRRGYELISDEQVS